MLHVPGPTWKYILEQPDEAQLEILRALKTIEARPLSGEYLPFPWTGEILGFTTELYSINYRLIDEIPEITGITKMPTADDIRRALLG